MLEQDLHLQLILPVDRAAELLPLLHFLLVRDSLQAVIGDPELAQLVAWARLTVQHVSSPKPAAAEAGPSRLLQVKLHEKWNWDLLEAAH